MSELIYQSASKQAEHRRQSGQAHSNKSALQDNREHTMQHKILTDARPATVQRNNTGMPDKLKTGIENLSGMNMDHVKVHYNSAKPAQLNAHAYAQGSQIHIAPGQEKHLPHEAWHVVQQAQGRVKPTMQMKAGTPINDNAGLEKEADVMGAKAAATSGEINPFMKPGAMVKQSGVSGSIKQLFKVPRGLAEISNSITIVRDEIRDTKPKSAELPNGDRWAREVQSATFRHLNEWKLYKTMQQAYPKLKTSFGSDNTIEPDVMVKDKKGKLIAAGESKYVTGTAKQVRKNTKSAQKQLLDGNRAKTYSSNVDRYAFITVDPNSDAGERIKMEEKVKGQKAFNNRKRAAEEDHDEATKRLKTANPNADFRTHINIGDDPIYTFL